MTHVTTIKLVLGVVALVIFAIGARVDSPVLRWLAVGVLVVAVALRLAKPRS